MTTATPCHPRQAAFTLLETLLALALFSISIVVLATAYVNILTSLELTKADQIIEQEMAFVRERILRAATREEVEEGGELETLGLGLARWEATIEPTEVADLFRVQAVLSFAGSDRRDAFSVEQTLLALRPAWSLPVEREQLRAATRDRLLKEQATRPR
jgi:general secretion pathway protein I